MDFKKVLIIKDS